MFSVSLEFRLTVMLTVYCQGYDFDDNVRLRVGLELCLGASVMVRIGDNLRGRM